MARRLPRVSAAPSAPNSAANRLTSSLRFAPVSVVMPMDYSALLWGTVYGWLLFDQLPAATTWLGAPLVIGAGVVIAWREHHLRVKARAVTTASRCFCKGKTSSR